MTATGIVVTVIALAAVTAIWAVLAAATMRYVRTGRWFR